MSMIYECPRCHTPQAAGQTACLRCGAEFDSPVPDDAFLPGGEAALPLPSPEPVLAAVPSDPVSAGVPLLPSAEAPSFAAAMPLVGMAPLAQAEPLPPEEEAKPAGQVRESILPPREAHPVAPSFPEPQPYQSSPLQSSPFPEPVYQSEAAQAAPTEIPASSAGINSSSHDLLPRLLLIAIPLVLILVIGGIFLVRSLDTGQDAVSVPPPLPVTTPIAAAPASAAPPLVVNGGVGTPSISGDPKAQWLVGRWEAKTTDYYVFRSDGTGAQGSITGKKPQGRFLWVLVQNRLILYTDKQEKLAFSQGPDDNTLYLREESGKYIQFARTQTQP